MAAVPFLIRRQSVPADTSTAVTPPRLSHSVSIGNAGPDWLFVYDSEANAEAQTHYLAIAPGHERTVAIPKESLWRIDHHGFSPQQTAFWVRTPQAGEVALTWF